MGPTCRAGRRDPDVVPEAGERRRDRVAADVEQGSAAVIGIEPVVVGRDAGEGEPGPSLDLAGDVAEQRLDPAGARVPPVPRRLDEHRSRRLRGSSHQSDLGRVEPEGLLAQHVLPGLERGDHPGQVEVVGKRDVDDVDVFGLARRGVRVDGPHGLQRGGAPGVAGRHHLQHRAARPVHDRCDRPGGDEPGTEETPAHRRNGHLGTTGRPSSSADSRAASMTARTRRDWAAVTVIGMPRRSRSATSRWNG